MVTKPTSGMTLSSTGVTNKEAVTMCYPTNTKHRALSTTCIITALDLLIFNFPKPSCKQYLYVHSLLNS